MSGDVAVELGQPVPDDAGGAAQPAEVPTPDAATADASATDVPVVRVVRGNPTPEQLAALTVVLAAASGAEEPPPPRRTLWTARSRFARPRPAIGPGGWRASALPR